MPAVGGECGTPAEFWFAVTKSITGPAGGLFSGWNDQLCTLARLTRPERDVLVAILPASRPTLEEIARFLRANAAVAVVVTGHTDAQGAFDYNVALSLRRAQAVVATLARDFAIPPARLTALGAGMAAPIAAIPPMPGVRKIAR